MSTPVIDPAFSTVRMAERNGIHSEDRDEVWEGVPFMSPIANTEHQKIATKLGFIMDLSLDQRPDVDVYVGVNVSDRVDDWSSNYRIPDVAVVLPGSKARNCGAHLCGGPDFLTEILSEGDRSHEKLDFYAKIGVRELLLIDRDPWALSLYRLQGAELVLVGHATVENGERLTSTVLPVSFKLLAGTPRPRIEVTHQDGQRRWII